MKVIPAEDSDNEKSSLKSPNDSEEGGDKDKGDDDGEEGYQSSSDEDLNRASAMNERKEYKNHILT